MTKLNKRILSALLAAILFLTNFPMVSSASNDFAITYEGKTVSQVEFFEHEKITVSAQGNPGSDYQWQIQIPGTEQWVNIQGQTGQTIKLSKAVVGSLLVNGSAYVRCAAINDGEEIDHTAALCTTVKKEEPAPVAPVVNAPVVTPVEPVPEATEAPTEAPAEPIPETTEPPVEVTEAPIEPIPEATEVTIEETAAPTEPAVENEPVPEVVEPSEVPVETTEIPEEIVEIPAETAAPVEMEAEVVVTAPAEAPTEEPAAVPEIPAETAASTEPEAEVVVTAPAENSAKPAEAPTEEPAAVPEIPAETAAPVEMEAEVVVTAPAENSAKPAEAPTEEPATAPVEEEPAETFVDKVVKFFAPRAAADESSDIEIVTVTVHYRAVDRENKFETTHMDAGLKENAAAAEPVTDPYVAHIVSGSDLEVTVPCHVMPGYTLTVPAFHKDDPISVISNNLVLNLSGVTEDQTFYIYYVESEVSYTARYFMQNVYNDLYTERTDILTTEIQNKMKGYPNAEPDPEIIYPDIYGFTALFFQPDTIAADGSTVFEVYYDRNYYLMNFNMLGGFGTAPVYARYGTAFTVANPTKAGHVFTQWELETVNGVTATDAQKAEAFPTTIPAENRTYKAVWVQGATSYTVAYWLENANTTGYSFHSSKVVGLGADGEPDGSVESDDRVSAADYASDTAIFGIDGPFVFYDNTKTLEKQNSRDDLDSDQKVIVQGDGSTVLNVYFKRKEYNLKFYYAMKTVDDELLGMDGHQHVYVIGGSTYYFGSWANNSDTGNDVAILSQYMAEDKLHRGWVKEVPELNAYGKSRGYTTGTEKATVGGTEYLYYYLMFSARYGQDISAKWPCDVFEPAERADTATDYNGWSGTKAYASAWNGEHHVWYSQNTPDNQTIKGKYQKLDHQILWASEFGDPADGTVSYLCFWENGTEASGLTWSVPELWYYRLWLPVLGDVPEGKETTTRMVSIDGTQQEITYVLSENYATCDDSDLGGQTFISIDGYGDDTRDPGEKDTEVGFKKEIKDNAAKTELKAKYGYTDEMLSTYKEVHIADFFYGRTNYCLKYHNRTGYIGNGEGAEVPYGKSLVLYGDQGEYVNKTKMETTHYPKEFEPNAYTFEGWYTSEDCLPGTEMVWTGTMPARNVEVYAKWEPVKYNTYFYMDYERYMDGTPFHTATNTSHGESILSEKLNELQNLVFKDKTNEANTKYLFVNWFYIDTDGTKKAFNPSEMAVRKELHLFAEWTSSEVKEYTVSYHQGKWNETTKEYESLGILAEDSRGYALEATTKTFTALPKDKLTRLPAGTESQLWLPHTNSHSIVMREDNEDNVFTFYYITKEEAPYVVRYLDATTHEPIWKDADGKERKGGDEHNKDAIVTIPFKYFSGYIPDAFHKRLVLSANDEENVVIFYYTKDENASGGDTGGGVSSQRYLVMHHYPAIEGDPNSEDVVQEYDYIDQVGKLVTATQESQKGFVFDETKTKEKFNEQFGTTNANQYVKQVDGKWTVSGEVTSGKDNDANKPLVLNLYYSREKFSYKVQYIDWETKDPIRDGKTVGGIPFGKTVSENSIEITGYDLYGADESGKKTLDLTISWDKDKNVITFEYIKKKVTIKYVPICTEPGLTGGFGGVSNPIDYDKTTPSGSGAFAASGFYFKGWYSDEEGNTRVEEDVYFRPQVDLSTGIYDYTYYALFEPITLTISQQNIAENDSAVYEVLQGTTVVARVMLTGTDSVTLMAIPAGNYTVKEVSGNWTWTYNDPAPVSGTVEVVAGQENAVTFNYADCHVGSCWLHNETRR